MITAATATIGVLMIFTVEQSYLPAVKAAANKYNVPEALILAHIKQESGYKPTAYRAEPAINDASYGMMQLLLKTAQSLDCSATVEKLYDPTYNIDLGTKYIAQNMVRYPNNIKAAIASYNAGSAYTDENGEYISK